MDLLETLKNLASERCKASSNEEAICNSDNIPVHEDLETILDAAVDISASQGRTDGVLRVDAILRSMMDRGRTISKSSG